ncbi:MAG: HD family phosphohydrolase, partial [Planctomycetaceae bacterium]
MPFFGQKRHRHVRTLSVRGPETRRAWLWSRLTNRSMMGRLTLCLLAVLLTLVAVFSWRVPFPYREGQRVASGVSASIDFKVRNDSETARLRANARAAAAYVFQHDPRVLDVLPNNFRAALQDIEQAEHLDELEAGVRREFGLDENVATAPDGFQAPRERFDAIKAAVAPNNVVTTQARIEDLVHDFTYFIAPLRQTGVISQADAANLGINFDSPIQIVNTVAPRPPEETPGQDPSTRYRLPDVSLPSLLADSGALGSKWASYPNLTPIRPLVRYWLTRQQNLVTLRYDQAATNDAKSAAENAVADVMMPFARGDLLVSPGVVLQAEHLDLLSAEYNELRNRAEWSDVLFRVAVVFVMLAALAVLNGYYLLRNEPNVIRSVSRLVVYLVAIVAAVALGRLLSFDPWRAEVIPLVATVMIFAIAYNQVFAALTGFTLCLIVTLATTSQLSQFVVLMTTAATVVIPLSYMSSRTTLVKAGFVAGLAYLVVSLCVGVLDSQNAVELLSDVGMVKQSLKGAAWCLFAGYFVAGSLPFIESTFGVITDISLLEMSDPAHPLLQELVRRAPGTYNHSISVASIGEAAADAIGANGLLVRVGAYFHDAGKMLKPQYFIENVQAGAESRHNHLAPAMSTLIIIGHVRDGVDLAEQYNLPQQLIDFIEQHHGTTLVEYFFHEATRQAEQSTDHKFDAEESSFRYPGPKPQTKEAGVMMLADAVESASRTLRDPTAKRLETLVHDLTMKRLLDGQ